MTHCGDFRRWIQLAMDGVLPPMEERDLSRHLATCPECQREKVLLGRVRQLVERTGALSPGADLSPTFDARFYAALRREMAPSYRWSRIWKPVAAVGFAVGVVWVGLSRPWTPTSPAVTIQEDSLLTASALSAVSAEERTLADERARTMLLGVPL